MPEPPRRKRFQIHLSTAIVLMFVAGALMWANLNYRVIENVGLTYHYGELVSPAKWFRETSNDVWSGDCKGMYGWPCGFVHGTNRVNIYRTGETLYELGTGNWCWTGLSVDVMIAQAIVFVAYFLCEYLIRRRAARKGA